MNSLSAPKETKAEKEIRTGLKNPFEVKYEEYLRAQLQERGHEKLLKYHDPEHGSDDDFEEPDMNLIDEHVKNKPRESDEEEEYEQEKRTDVPLSNKRRKLDTTPRDDGDSQVYQMRVALIKPSGAETKCIKGKLLIIPLSFNNHFYFC